MSTLLIHQGLLGFVRLLTTAVAAGWVGAPMSWSPDARWLSYTVAPEMAPADRRPGWIFDAAAPAEPEHPAPARPGPYQVWASQRDGESSVLIEESAWPMTAPRWSPRGRSLAFGRFVPDAAEARGAEVRGRIEVVIQDRLDRKRSAAAVPAFDLDDEARARFPQVSPTWSPDGQFLALPTPGHVPSILIVRVDSRRVVQTIDRALFPSWSPDGARLAFLRQDETGSYSLHVAEPAQTFSTSRAIAPIGGVAAPIGWGGDGRSILAVVEPARRRSPNLDLVRIAPETGESAPVFSIAPEALRRMARVRGLAIDFDRNEDLCFFSVDLEGRDTDVCWSVPREQLPYKRFHPLDPSMRVVGLAIAPDGRAVAMRFGTPEGLSPPAVCELETEHVPPTERTTLIVADEAARRAWLGLLAGTSRSLLAIAMSPIVADGEPVARPTVLPLPDEIPAAPHVRGRFARLGRYGASLCTGRGRPGAAEAAPGSERDLEDRLFFDYLRADYAAAMAGLEALEARLDSPGRRLATLSLRAQILWGRGDLDAAREVADFLVEAAGGPAYLVEETPAGRSLTRVDDPDRTWARYLARRAGQPASPAAEPSPADRDNPLQGDPFAPFAPHGLDLLRPGPGDRLPFAPNPQGIPPDELIRLQLQILRRQQQQLRIDPQRRPALPPPPPRPIR